MPQKEKKKKKGKERKKKAVVPFLDLRSIIIQWLEEAKLLGEGSV